MRIRGRRAHAGPRWRRHGTVAALVAIAACAPPTASIATGLDEDQCRETVAVLGAAGIAARREGNDSRRGKGCRVAVPVDDAAQAASVLAAENVPRPRRAGLAGLGAAGGLLAMPSEEHARLSHALGEEIAGHLEQLDAVAAASVIVSIPADDPLAPASAAKPRPTASVLLKLRPGRKAPDADSVRRLVAGAAFGMAPDSVAVVTDAAQPPARAIPSRLSSVGPFWVAPSSRRALKAVLIAGCASMLVMGLWILLGERSRRVRGRG